MPADIVARLKHLHPVLIDLGLGRVEALLRKLGDPQQLLPPVLHVAGTNGKGSTCAFLRAMAEAAGLRAHVFTSPHLVRFNERIRLAGALVTDTAFAAVLDEVEAVNAGAPITVFEIITVCAFVLFARVPAEVTILEVGLGGRLDATNVVARPEACGITSVSFDHQEFLGDTLGAIAAEKAGIIKPGVPVVTGRQAPEAMATIEAAAAGRAALHARDREWRIAPGRFEDAGGAVAVPVLGLAGAHQWDNAGVAMAMLRASGLGVRDAALAEGAAAAVWPARLQRLSGRLAALLPPGWALWLDGGHNAGGAAALAEVLRGWAGQTVHVIVGLKQTKDPAAFLAPVLPFAASVQAVAEPGQHLAMPVEAIVAAAPGAVAGPTLVPALRRLAVLPGPARVLICGSLHLAGEALRQDGAVID